MKTRLCILDIKTFPLRVKIRKTSVYVCKLHRLGLSSVYTHASFGASWKCRSLNRQLRIVNSTQPRARLVAASRDAHRGGSSGVLSSSLHPPVWASAASGGFRGNAWEPAPGQTATKKTRFLQ